MPLAAPLILAWIWQRWELEVAHREMKAALGVGQKQCWNPRSAVVSVQWSVWVYAVLVLAGYQAWGLFGGPRRPERWWPGAQTLEFQHFVARLPGRPLGHQANFGPFGRRPETTGPKRRPGWPG